MTAIYERIGVGYAAGRRPDPRWQAALDAAVGHASTVLNIGAGTGSYEPSDRYVLAVEPSATMIAQRPAAAAPALMASAERLPVADGQFDVATGILTLHHWADWRAGLREARRVATRVVLVHFDPVRHLGFWLARDYLPELADVWRDVPSARAVATELGPAATVRALPVPWDCCDAFLPAYWRRPEAYLQLDVRRTMSGLQLLDPAVLARGLRALHTDLADGTWHRRCADLLVLEELDVGFCVISSS